jgi:hypothetical protein
MESRKSWLEGPGTLPIRGRSAATSAPRSALFPGSPFMADTPGTVDEPGELEVHGCNLFDVADRVIARSEFRFSPSDREDVRQELVLAGWQLSKSHDERAYPGKFERGCARILAFRLTDIVRKRQQRTRWAFGEGNKEGKRYAATNGVYERERVEVLSLPLDTAYRLLRDSCSRISAASSSNAALTSFRGHPIAEAISVRENPAQVGTAICRRIHAPVSDKVAQETPSGGGRSEPQARGERNPSARVGRGRPPITSLSAASSSIVAPTRSAAKPTSSIRHRLVTRGKYSAPALGGPA